MTTPLHPKASAWIQKAYELLLEKHNMKEGESDPKACEEIHYWAISLWMDYEGAPEAAVNEELSCA